MKTILAIVAALLLSTSAAFAQNYWATPGGSNANGSVEMCLNSSGNAVPVSSGACANSPTPHLLSSAGAGQYDVSITSATKLTVPTGATIAEICAESAAAWYKDDGGTPTAAAGGGIPLAEGACIQYSGPLAAFDIIGASGAKMDVSYYY